MMLSVARPSPSMLICMACLFITSVKAYSVNSEPVALGDLRVQRNLGQGHLLQLVNFRVQSMHDQQVIVYRQMRVVHARFHLFKAQPHDGASPK